MKLPPDRLPAYVVIALAVGLAIWMFKLSKDPRQVDIGAFFAILGLYALFVALGFAIALVFREFKR